MKTFVLCFHLILSECDFKWFVTHYFCYHNLLRNNGFKCLDSIKICINSTSWFTWAFQLSSNEATCKCKEMQKTWVWSLGWEDPIEEGVAAHPSALAWSIPRPGEPGGCSYIMVKSQPWLSEHAQHTKFQSCFYRSLHPHLSSLRWVRFITSLL